MIELWYTLHSFYLFICFLATLVVVRKKKKILTEKDNKENDFMILLLVDFHILFKHNKLLQKLNYIKIMKKNPSFTLLVNTSTPIEIRNFIQTSV